MKKYNFSTEVWELFREVGWYQGRNVKDSLEIPLEEYPNYTQFVLDFLYEFGGLDIKRNKKKIASESIDFTPNIAKREMEEDGTYQYYSDLVQTQLYPLGYTEQSGDLVVDGKGNIYTLGDYCIWLGESLEEGIEKLLLGDFSQWKQLDEDTGEWLSNK